MLSLISRSRITPSPLKSQQPVTELSDEFDSFQLKFYQRVRGRLCEEQEYQEHQRKDPHPLI